MTLGTTWRKSSPFVKGTRSRPTTCETSSANSPKVSRSCLTTHEAVLLNETSHRRMEGVDNLQQVVSFGPYFFPGMLPNSWNRYTVPKSLTVITWMQDFSDRIKQLQKLSDAGNSQGPIGFKSIPVGRVRTHQLMSVRCSLLLLIGSIKRRL